MADSMSHERIMSLKRTKAGHVGEITKITDVLDALLRDKRNWKEVQVYKERLVEQWGRYSRVFDSGVTRALIGGGGVYSYIRVLPDGFLLKLSSFQKKSVGQNTNI